MTWSYLAEATATSPPTARASPSGTLSRMTGLCEITVICSLLRGRNASRCSSTINYRCVWGCSPAFTTWMRMSALRSLEMSLEMRRRAGSPVDMWSSESVAPASLRSAKSRSSALTVSRQLRLKVLLHRSHSPVSPASRNLQAPEGLEGNRCSVKRGRVAKSASAMKHSIEMMKTPLRARSWASAS